MQHLKPSDIIAAAVPSIASTAISQFNQIAGLCGSLLGIAYLIWKWRREANEGASRK